VSIHRQFKKLVEEELNGFGPYAARLVAHPGEGAFPSLATLPTDSRLLLAVGPEGGWTPFELELLLSHGFIAASWGPRTLRTDTACAVLLGLVHSALK
jgi:RsmE family RNA methyltransferase